MALLVDDRSEPRWSSERKPYRHVTVCGICVCIFSIGTLITWRVQGIIYFYSTISGIRCDTLFLMVGITFKLAKVNSVPCMCTAALSLKQ